jgi:sugar phosphate isomerase/epimerase
VDTGDVNGFAALEKAMIYAMMVHAKFYEVDEDGKDKKQDWEKVFKLLNASRYEGYLSIEYEGKNPKVEVPRAAKFLAEKTMLT